MKSNPVRTFMAATLWMALLAVASPAFGQSVITTSTTALTFNATPGSNPAPQTFQVTSNNAALNYFVLAGTTTGGNWLGVSPSSGTAGGTVTVTVTSSSLAAGTYNGSIVVGSSNLSANQVNIPVTLNVSGTGTGTGSLSANPSSLSYSATPGSTTPVSQQVTVTSSTPVIMFATPFTQTGSGWLSVTPSNSATSTTSSTFTVTVTPTSLSSGIQYSGTVTITGGSSQITIPVTVNSGSTGGTTGNVSPTSVILGSSVGQTTPSTQTVLLNPPISTTYQITNVTTTSGNWLSVTPTSGTAPGTSVTVSANPVGLANGTYTGSFAVTFAGVGSTTVPVTFNVGGGSTGGGVLSFSPASLNFSYTTGATFPSQQVSVTANSPTSFTATASSQGWLSVSPATGTTSTFLNLAVNPTGLTTGVYNGTITVTPFGGVAQTIPVSLAVNSTGGGTGTCGSTTFSPSALTFNAVTGQTPPAAQTMTVNPGLSTTTFTVTASSAQNWLQVFPPSAQGAAFLSVSVQSQGLPAGTYTGSLNFNVGGNTCTIPVTLNVTGSGTGTGSNTANPTSLIFNVAPGTQPSNQTVTITTPQPTQFFLTPSVTGTSINWLAAGPNPGFTTSTTSTGTATATLNVGVANLASLPVGLYTGQIQVTFQTGGTLTIPVTLNLGNAPTGSVAPSQLNFTFQGGGVAPATQFLTLNTLNGAAATFTAQANLQSGTNWLTVAPASGTGPGVIAVSVNPNSLAAGTYNATVAVQLSGSTNPINIPVTLNVATNPVLRVNPTQANFNFQIGGSVGAGQTQNIEVTSTGAQLTFSATSSVNSPFGGNWLSVSQSTSTTPATVGIQVNAANLAAGTYTGTVTFSTAGQPALNIPVTLTVSSLPLLNPTPQILAFTSQLNQAPQPINLSVASTGGAVTFTPTAVTSTGQNWLSVVQTSSTTPNNVAVSVNPAGLAEGTYYGAVLITAAANTSGNSPLVVPVIYTVGGSTNLQVRPSTALTFTQIQGGTAPAAQSLEVASTGNLLTYTVTTTTLTGSGWLSATPPTNITPSSAAVSVNGASLPVGVYSGTVIISAQGAGNSPALIPVTLNVVAAPTVTAAPTSLTFNATTAGGNPASQTIQLTSSGANLPFTASTTVSGGAPNWLTVTPTSGNTPGSLTVGVNSSILQAGTYTGTVTINTGLPTPISIPVTLNLSAIQPASITSITNAASLLPTAVSPGMITAIFGSNLGPTTIATARLTAQNTVDTTLSNVRVLFDNIPAPLVYVRNDVVSAIVPYAVAGRATTNVVVEYQGVRSQPLNIRVVDAAPGIFTANSQGTGLGAIQNSDLSFNTAANAASRGTLAVLYFTGEGQLTPAGQDGVLASGTRRPVANVQVRVGGREAQVVYVGPVPTQVLGLGQLNFVVPGDAPTGANVPVEIIVGGVASQGGVTMAVR